MNGWVGVRPLAKVYSPNVSMTSSHIFEESYIKQIYCQAVTGTMDSEQGTLHKGQVLAGGLASVKSGFLLGSAFCNVECSWVSHLLLFRAIIFYSFVAF